MILISWVMWEIVLVLFWRYSFGGFVIKIVNIFYFWRLIRIEIIRER